MTTVNIYTNKQLSRFSRAEVHNALTSDFPGCEVTVNITVKQPEIQFAPGDVYQVTYSPLEVIAPYTYIRQVNGTWSGRGMKDSEMRERIANGTARKCKVVPE